LSTSGSAYQVALVQGCYFLVTGIWPILSIGTFQKVTGPKRDLWLVKTVGVVIIAIGAALLVAGWQREVTTAVVVLAVTGAVGLGAIDVIYAAKGVISRIYLLDAILEAALVAWWWGSF
jgi:energy-converting hydrogenase Eha subunit E